MDVPGGEGKAFRGFARGSVPAVRKGKFFLRPRARTSGAAGMPLAPQEMHRSGRIQRTVARVFRAKKKGPGNVRDPFLSRFWLTLRRHRYRCRRRREISRTNPCQISCWHCPRRTVNGAYTLIDMVNRVLTNMITAILAVMLCGSGGRRLASRSVRKTVEVFQDDSLDRHRSRDWRAASRFRHLRCLQRPRRPRDGAQDRSSI